MAKWNEFIDSALTKLSGARRGDKLPQLAVGSSDDEKSGKLVLLEGKKKRQERQVKQRLSYQLLEKMRRRALSWKSYYYHDEYQIPRLAITNDNATGAHVVERRYLVSFDQIIEANLYTNASGSVISIDVNDLQHVHRQQFDQLDQGKIGFQVYDKTFEMRIWYGNQDNNEHNQPQPLGKHKIFISGNVSFLLRPFRNLGADGFAAVANRLLIQEDIPVDTKNSIESLLMELGSEELLKHYQSALDTFNQKSALRRSMKLNQEASDVPLVITKVDRQKKNRNGEHDLVVDHPVSDSAYHLFAIMSDNHFAEIEEDLLYISLSSLSFDRSAVLDGCSALKEKLYQYVEDDMLIDKQLGNFYHFLRQETEERQLKETTVDSLRYSALEDEAYEEILVEVLEDLRWIIADYRYSSYLPLRSQIDQLQPIIHSLGQALEDARELHRRREITDSRQILTERAFESPNDQQYKISSSSENRSYYDQLLDVQQIIEDIKKQMCRSVSDVSLSLTKSAFLIVEISLQDFPILTSVSRKLLELMGHIMSSQDQSSEIIEQTVDTALVTSQNFELEIVDQLAHLIDEIQQALGDQVPGDDVRYLQSLSTELEQICLGDKLVSDNDWHSDYVKFVDQKVADFNDRIFQMAIDRQKQLERDLDDLNELVDTFVSGLSVPALLPSQLHESGNGIQTYLVQELQSYLNTQNLQLHTVPGQEQQLQSLLNELLPKRLDTPIEQVEYFFRFC